MNRIWGLDILRIISIAAVIVIHTTQYLIRIEVGTYDWMVLNVYDSLARWAVPVFVMISGVFFLDPAKPQPLKKLFGKKNPHILTIIIFWGFVYAALHHLPQTLNLASLWKFFQTWILGYYHMWFLYMILGLYLVTPILRCITASKQGTLYFLLLAGTLNCVLPYLPDWGPFNLIGTFAGKMEFNIPLGYSFYFVLGYWLQSEDIPKKIRIALYSLGGVATAGTILLTTLLSIDAGSTDTSFYDNFSPTVCLASIAIFVAFKHLRAPKDSAAFKKKAIAVLSKSTLGVYMIHMIVLDGLSDIGLSCFSFNPALAVPATAIAAVALSYAIAVIMTKIPLFNRYFV